MLFQGKIVTYQSRISVSALFYAPFVGLITRRSEVQILLPLQRGRPSVLVKRPGGFRFSRSLFLHLFPLHLSAFYAPRENYFVSRICHVYVTLRASCTQGFYRSILQLNQSLDAYRFWQSHYWSDPFNLSKHSTSITKYPAISPFS